MKPTFKASSTLRNLSQRSLLAASVTAVMAVSSLSHALTPISEDEMSASTGEGIAMLAENFGFRLNSVDNLNQDTGYIRYIPVGPLTQVATNAGASKGDLFLYGLALSQAEAVPDLNSRYGVNIGSWGTASNPWLLRAWTDTAVPNFSGANGPVSYLTLEAPAYDQTLPSTSASGADAYNLKLAFWADAFVRDPNIAEDMNATGSQFNVVAAGRPNRLRLQAIWNGLSLNGSNMRIFRTQAGVTATQVSNEGMSLEYNNTLGLSALLRLNSGPSNNAASGGFAAVSPAVMQTQALRFSTQETGTVQGILSTPAINKGAAPTFNANEGLFAYTPNINLVLGQLYQPLVMDVAPDGKNIVLELARVPNQASIYNKLYTDYSDPNSATYTGTTCSVYYCGATGGTYSMTTYQGNSATHSSITIGTTIWDPTNRRVTADSSTNAIGVSFGTLATPTTAGNFTTSINNLGSAVIDGFFVQHMKITTKGL